MVHTVRAVNHHDFRQLFLPQRFPGGLDALPVEVCALASTTEDHEAVLVSGGSGDSS